MCISTLALCLSLSVAVADQAPDIVAEKGNERDAEFFIQRIQPIFKKHCYECHSAAADEIKGDLRLDTIEGVEKGGNNGPLVRPGDLENSFLLRVIRYQEDDYQMPPRGKLPDKIIEGFETWVKAGASLPKKK